MCSCHRWNIPHYVFQCDKPHASRSPLNSVQTPNLTKPRSVSASQRSFWAQWTGLRSAVSAGETLTSWVTRSCMIILRRREDVCLLTDDRLTLERSSSTSVFISASSQIWPVAPEKISCHTAQQPCWHNKNRGETQEVLMSDVPHSYGMKTETQKWLNQILI